MEKNPEFCNKFGIKNTSEYIAEKETEEQEIKKAIEIEKQWMASSMNKGLPETII
jgi:glutamine synthetase type III